MAPSTLPPSGPLLARALMVAAPDIAKISARHVVSSRGLGVNSTQAVTLGVMAAYVVVIALLWNIPYVRYSLWPFKVSALSWDVDVDCRLTHPHRCWS
jgi:hypothetical protein